MSFLAHSSDLILEASKQAQQPRPTTSVNNDNETIPTTNMADNRALDLEHLGLISVLMFKFEICSRVLILKLFVCATRLVRFDATAEYCTGVCMAGVPLYPFQCGLAALLHFR